MTPAEKDRVRGKLLEIRTKVQDALRIVNRAIGPPPQHPNMWRNELLIELFWIAAKKRWEMVESIFPQTGGVNFKDIYILQDKLLAVLYSIGVLNLDDLSLQDIKLRIDQAIAHLEQMRRQIPATEHGAIEGLITRLRKLRMIAQLGRRIPNRPRWLNRWWRRMLRRALFQRARGIPRISGVWIKLLGINNGIPDLGGIIDDLGRIDYLVERINLPPEGSPGAAQEALERALDVIRRLFLKFDAIKTS